MTRRLRFKLALWYMGRIAGRYCPCEWPVKVKWLMRICGRIDDCADRAEFHRFCAFHLAQYQTTTGSSANMDVKIRWNKPA